MSEIDVLRGFKAPNSERNFQRINDTTLRSTNEEEEIFFNNRLPIYIALHKTEFVQAGRIATGAIELKTSKDTLDAVVVELKENGFREAPASQEG